MVSSVFNIIPGNMLRISQHNVQETTNLNILRILSMEHQGIHKSTQNFSCFEIEPENLDKT